MEKNAGRNRGKKQCWLLFADFFRQVEEIQHQMRRTTQRIKRRHFICLGLFSPFYFVIFIFYKMFFEQFFFLVYKKKVRNKK